MREPEVYGQLTAVRCTLRETGGVKTVKRNPAPEGPKKIGAEIRAVISACRIVQRILITSAAY